LAAYTRPSGIICERTSPMTEVSAKVIRIGPESRCSVFHKDGVVYATILGNAPRFRPSEACCEVKDTNKGMVVSDSQSNGGGVGQGVGGNLLSIFADGRNQGVVRSDKNKATRVDFMDPLLGQVVTGVPGELRTGKGTCVRKPAIYKITCPTGKAYVGQSVNVAKRFKKHQSGKSNCRAINNAIQLYGWKNTKKEILLYCKEEELDELEDAMIDEHNTMYPNGYNLVRGGGVNPIKDPEVYKRVRSMWDAGVIQEKQRQAWNRPGLRDRMRKVHKNRCQDDGGRQARQGATNLISGNATEASHSLTATAKRAATWESKRQAKIASLDPDEAAKVIAQSKRKKTSYIDACIAAGGAEALREKRREWARKRRERGGK